MHAGTDSALAGPDCSSGPGTGKAVVVAVAVWLAVIAGVVVIHLEHPSVRRLALFFHLLSLAIGFGAVVVVDVCGILWMLGRRTARDVLTLASMTHPLISLGVGGLLISGTLLHPDLTSPLVWVKLALVLVIMLNGVSVPRLASRMRAIPGDVGGDNIPWGYIPAAFATAAISQIAWMGATAIGFLTTTVRQG